MSAVVAQQKYTKWHEKRIIDWSKKEVLKKRRFVKKIHLIACKILYLVKSVAI